MSGIADVHEIFIYGDTMEDQQKKLVAFLEKIPELITDDKYFHFLYERGCLLIRFNGIVYKTKVENTLSNLNYSHEYHDSWREGSEMVEKYQEFFCYYMNALSVFSINSDDKDSEKIFERILHLAFEAFEYKFFKKHGSMFLLESHLLNHVSMERAFTEGYFSEK